MTLNMMDVRVKVRGAAFVIRPQDREIVDELRAKGYTDEAIQNKLRHIRQMETIARTQNGAATDQG